MEITLKQGDILRVKHAVALIGMDEGEYYRVEYLVDIAARELDFWVGEDSIEMISTQTR